MATGLRTPDAPSRPPGAEPRPEPRPRRRRWRHPVAATILIVIGAILLLVLAWIGIRGFLGQRALNDAIPVADRLTSAVAAGDFATAQRSAKTLSAHTGDAAALTSDPVWRAVEVVPWVGDNLRAVRTAAGSSDQIAKNVVRPLVAAGAAVDLRSLAAAGGKIDLAPIVAAQPAVAKAHAAFVAAHAGVASIPTDTLFGPVAQGVHRLSGLLDRAAPGMDAIANATRLLPSMLGADGPRDYLLAAQNPAELRATGGLIGAVALVHADKGTITLQRQAAGSSIGPWKAAVADVPLSTQGLYGPLVGRFWQDANLTPDFPLAAATASQMWITANGGTVDGVVAVDPVVLSALLKATGPVDLPTGDRLTAANAVPLLLSEVYQRYEQPADQDTFFAEAASAVFGRLAAGGADGAKLVSALAQAGESRRVLIWSAHDGDQKVLSGTTLAGELPDSDASTAAIGVYLNDATGAKMDYYLSAKVAAGAAVCRADKTPSTVVRVTLTNRAPADAATALTRYVTGGGTSGVAPGTIRTRISVYGPNGGLLAATLSGGSAYPTVAGVDQERPVSLATVDLAPGESRTIEVQFLNLEQKTPKLSVVTTPTLPGDVSTPIVGGKSVVAPIVVQCSSIVK